MQVICRIVNRLYRCFGGESLNKYVWCEDTGSGFDFWKAVFNTLYEDFIVETKKNNSELCRAVSKLRDEENRYYILMDNAVDNQEVLRETQRLHSVVKGKQNVSVIKIHSFEFVLLSFQRLYDWVFAEQDELKEKRKGLLELANKLVDIICNGGDIKKLSSAREALNYSDSLNTEQLSAKLLFDITRNTGFETTKGKLGDCFIVDCCDWEARGDDDICGLDQSRISGRSKIKEVFENSVLKDSFTKAGL